MRIANEISLTAFLANKAPNDSAQAEWFVNRLSVLIKKEQIGIVPLNSSLVVSKLDGFDKKDAQHGTLGVFDPMLWGVGDQGKLTHIRDWMNENPTMPLIDLRGYQTFDSLNQAAESYFRAKAEALVREDLKDGISEILKVSGDMTWVSISTEKGLKAEGAAMSHCVGSYYYRIDRGQSRIYSLRDSQNIPHLTVEVYVTDNRLGQVQNRSGYGGGKYVDQATKLMKHLGCTYSEPQIKNRDSEENWKIRVAGVFYPREEALAKFGTQRIFATYENGWKWVQNLAPRASNPNHRYEYSHLDLINEEGEVVAYFMTRGGDEFSWASASLYFNYDKYNNAFFKEYVRDALNEYKVAVGSTLLNSFGICRVGARYYSNPPAESEDLKTGALKCSAWDAGFGYKEEWNIGAFKLPAGSISCPSIEISGVIGALPRRITSPKIILRDLKTETSRSLVEMHGTRLTVDTCEEGGRIASVFKGQDGKAEMLRVVGGKDFVVPDLDYGILYLYGCTGVILPAKLRVSMWLDLGNSYIGSCERQQGSWDQAKLKAILKRMGNMRW